MKKDKFKFFKLKIPRRNLNNLNIYLFLGFNLTLVSVLGFFWINSALKSLV